MLKYVLISIRPKQWYKNSLIFVAIIFSANFLNVSMWVTALLAFIYFCMLSAGVYLVNDILDRARDKKHPVKSQRPIAAGQLKVLHASLFALLLIALALLGSFSTININFFIIAGTYVILALLYSLILKHFIIIDVLVISIGFVFRAIAGALSINVSISPWLIICTFLLALFLTLEKRWYEVSTLGNDAEAHRSNLSQYSATMLHQLVSITSAALITSYLLYTFFTGNVLMLLTAPSAIYGLFRYMYLVHEKKFEVEPEVLFKDKAMLINLCLWIILVVLIILHANLSLI